MKTRLRNDLAAGLVGVAVGLCVAAWLATSRHAYAGDTLAAHVAATPAAATAPTTPDASTDSQPTPARVTAPSATVPDRRPLWQTLASVEVPGDKASQWIKVPALRAKGPPAPPSPLNPEFAEFFGLNDAEQRAIVAELKAVGTRQAELDLQAARPLPIDESDGFLAKYEIALRIAPYPEAGAALYDQLRAKLTATLGEERMAVYQNWSDTSLLADWQGLGLAERTLHIKRQHLGADFKLWDVNYQAKAPDGGYQQFNSMGTASLADFELLVNFPVGRWLETHPLPAPTSTKSGSSGGAK